MCSICHILKVNCFLNDTIQAFWLLFKHYIRCIVSVSEKSHCVVFHFYRYNSSGSVKQPQKDGIVTNMIKQELFSPFSNLYYWQLAFFILLLCCSSLQILYWILQWKWIISIKRAGFFLLLFFFIRKLFPSVLHSRRSDVRLIWVSSRLIKAIVLTMRLDKCCI